MAAGGKGDHPLIDILDSKLRVYSKECDDLVREISKYSSREEMLAGFDWFNSEYFKEPSKFAQVLRIALEKLRVDRNARGWEHDMES